MRYYTINFLDPKTRKVVKTYTSFPGNQTDLGALDIELDLLVKDQTAATLTGAFVAIYGVPITDIKQASNFNGYLVEVFAGMQKGLPLANPTQAGLLMSGLILQAYGNWIGVEQTLTLQIVGGPDGPGSPENPKNLVLTWRAGQNLASAITTTLQTAFPGCTVNCNLSPNLVLSHDETGYYQSLEQFGYIVRHLSVSLMGKDYPGVSIVLKEKVFTVYDGTSQAKPKEIVFTDLIGQPTWVAANTIQMAVVMRADISIGDYLTLPKTAITTTPASFSQERTNSIFQGTYIVNSVRHVGRFRQADAGSWVTVLTMNDTTKLKVT